MPTAPVSMPASLRMRSANGRLITRSDRYLRGGDVAAGGAIDQINAQRLQLARQLHRLLDVPSAFGPIGGGDPGEEWQ